MTHKLTIKDKEYLLVEVPKDAYDFKLGNCPMLGEENEGRRKYYVSYKMPNLPDYANHHSITYSTTYFTAKIINAISNLTEEECKELVENLFTDEAWKDYTVKENIGYGNYKLLTAKESFISLLQSKNILAKENEDLLLIKINN